MRRNAIARIVLYSVLALMLTGILVTGILTDSFMVHFGSESGTIVEHEAAVAAADVRNIEIDWAAGSIEFVVADTDQIIFRETSAENSKYEMTYTLSGDTLKLSYGSGGITIGFGNFSFPGKDLVITVPRDWVCEELEIDGASLSIHIQDMTLGTLDLDGASCDVFFTGSLEELEADGASTNITLSCTNRISRVSMDGASCDLELTLPEDCGFTLSMDGLSCDLHTQLPCSAINGRTVHGDGYCKINVDGLSCDVTIKEAAGCTHEWGPGMPTVDIVTGESDTIYTCRICGKHTTVPWS